MPGGAAAGFSKGVYGIGVRKDLYAGEDKYFKNNPHVAGMAAEDDKIIINPWNPGTTTGNCTIPELYCTSTNSYEFVLLYR